MTDIAEAADLLRKQPRESFACASCGSPDPVRIEGSVCANCSDFPRCVNCGRWVGDGLGWLPGYVHVLVGSDDVRVCMPCWKAI